MSSPKSSSNSNLGKSLHITSKSNDHYRMLLTLLTAKGIKENSKFFLMGEKLVTEFLTSPIKGFEIDSVVMTGDTELKSSARRTILPSEMFAELDVLGTKFPMLVLSFSTFEEFNTDTSPKGLEIVCPLGDPRNLGALVRTGLAFGVSSVILTKESAHPYLPQSVKASAGAALKTRFLKFNGMTDELKIVGDNFALSLHGENLAKAKLPQNMRLWVGEEGPGLKLSHEQKRIIKNLNIKTAEVESLNAALSVGLAIWEWKKQNEQK